MLRESVRLCWQIVASVAFCLLLSTDLVAADLNMRRLASEASDAQPPDSRRREQLDRRFIKYERRRANLLNNGLGLAKLPKPRPDMGKLGRGLEFLKLLGEMENAFWSRNFQRELGELRARDIELYREVLGSRMGSFERARLVRQALPTDMSCDDCSAEQRLDLLKYDLEKTQRYLVLNFEDHAAIGVGEGGIGRDTALRLGREFRKRDSRIANLSEKTRNLQDQLTTQLERTEFQVEGIESGVARLGKAVVQQDRILTEHGDILNMHGELIGKHELRLNDLEGEVIDLDRAYGQLSDDVQFNQTLLYDALPVSAKIEALKNPRFLMERFPNEEERQEVIDRLKVQETAQNVLSTTRDVQDGTHAVANILLQTGVLDPEDAKDAREIVDKASGLVSVGASIVTGNVLGVLTGVSSLLGGGGPAPNPQVMAALDEISERQREMLQRQKQLLEGQQKILQGQQDILEKVKDFERQLTAFEGNMIAGFDEIRHSITEVQWEIAQLGQTFRAYSYLGVNLDNCEDFTKRRTRYRFVSDRDREYVPEIVTFMTGDWRDWDGLRSHYEANRKEWKICFWDVMRTLFSASRIHQAFLMSTYTSDEGQGLLSNYVNPGFKPLVRLLARRYPLEAESTKPEERMRTFCSLLNSPLTYDGIDYRGYTLFANDTERYCRLDENSVDPVRTFYRDGDSKGLDSGPWLIHPDALIYLSYLLMEVLPYYQMTQEDGGLLTPNVIAHEEPKRDKIVEIEPVQTAYRLVNIAIAQQTLLTGDIFLPLIRRYLFAPSSDPDDRKDVISILKHNKFIVKNYLIMQLRRELQLRTKQNNSADQPGNVFADNMKLYRTIFRSRDADRDNYADLGRQDLRYERLFATYWEFSSDTNEVVLRLRNDPGAKVVKFPLPTPQEIFSGFYHVTREHEELVRLRGKIIDYALRNDLQLFSNGGDFVQDGYFVWH